MQPLPGLLLKGAVVLHRVTESGTEHTADVNPWTQDLLNPDTGRIPQTAR